MNYPRIRELRLLHNLKQEFVASQLGMSQPEYSRLENGIRDPKVEDIQKMAKLYGIKAASFIPESNLNENGFNEDNKLQRAISAHPSVPYWISLLEHHQQLLTSLIQAQERSETLFDKLIQLLNQQPKP